MSEFIFAMKNDREVLHWLASSMRVLLKRVEFLESGVACDKPDKSFSHVLRLDELVPVVHDVSDRRVEFLESRVVCGKPDKSFSHVLRLDELVPVVHDVSDHVHPDSQVSDEVQVNPCHDVHVCIAESFSPSREIESEGVQLEVQCAVASPCCGTMADPTVFPAAVPVSLDVFSEISSVLEVPGVSPEPVASLALAVEVQPFVQALTEQEAKRPYVSDEFSGAILCASASCRQGLDRCQEPLANVHVRPLMRSDRDAVPCDLFSAEAVVDEIISAEVPDESMFASVSADVAHVVPHDACSAAPVPVYSLCVRDVVPVSCSADPLKLDISAEIPPRISADSVATNASAAECYANNMG